MTLPRIPLDPSPDDARSDLRRELLRPEYQDQDVLGRVLGWLERRLDGAFDAASGAPPLTTLAAMLVLVLLVVAAGWLLSRQRLTSERDQVRAVLTDEQVTAAELRARAERARDEERYADAVVDGFRALALRQVERGVVDEAPGLTAQDVARTVADHYPDRAHAVTAGARLFDEVLYGDRPATLAQTTEVLALDDELAVAR